jgi:hypothetical protein
LLFIAALIYSGALSKKKNTTFEASKHLTFGLLKSNFLFNSKRPAITIDSANFTPEIERNTIFFINESAFNQINLKVGLVQYVGRCC